MNSVLLIRMGIGDSKLLKTAAFGVAARFQVHLIAVGALAFGGALAPEIGDAGLNVRIVLKILAVHHHGFAAEVHTAGTVGGSGVGHNVVASL